MRILIIDDDRLFQRTYELLLYSEGHELVPCLDRAEAEEALETSLFDVVLLDQNLQGQGHGPTGLDLIPRIRALSPAAEVLVVSGYWAPPGVIERALDQEHRGDPGVLHASGPITEVGP